MSDQYMENPDIDEQKEKKDGSGGSSLADGVNNARGLSKQIDKHSAGNGKFNKAMDKHSAGNGKFNKAMNKHSADNGKINKAADKHSRGGLEKKADKESPASAGSNANHKNPSGLSKGGSSSSSVKVSGNAGTAGSAGNSGAAAGTGGTAGGAAAGSAGGTATGSAAAGGATTGATAGATAGAAAGGAAAGGTAAAGVTVAAATGPVGWIVLLVVVIVVILLIVCCIFEIVMSFIGYANSEEYVQDSLAIEQRELENGLVVYHDNTNFKETIDGFVFTYDGTKYSVTGMEMPSSGYLAGIYDEIEADYNSIVSSDTDENHIYEGYEVINDYMDMWNSDGYKEIFAKIAQNSFSDADVKAICGYDTSKAESIATKFGNVIKPEYFTWENTGMKADSKEIGREYFVYVGGGASEDDSGGGTGVHIPGITDLLTTPTTPTSPGLSNLDDGLIRNPDIKIYLDSLMDAEILRYQASGEYEKHAEVVEQSNYTVSYHISMSIPTGKAIEADEYEYKYVTDEESMNQAQELIESIENKDYLALVKTSANAIKDGIWGAIKSLFQKDHSWRDYTVPKGYYDNLDPMGSSGTSVPGDISDIVISPEDNEDLIYLAGVIWAEAGNQQYTGKLAVGYVVMNRVHGKNLSIKEVIMEKNQFATYIPDHTWEKGCERFALMSTEERNANECWIAAVEAYNGRGTNPIGDRLFFRVPPNKNDLSNFKDPILIQDHVFHRGQYKW